MFFVIWRGKGILVIAAYVAAFVVGALVVHFVGTKAPPIISAIYVTCSAIAGFGIWEYARRIESEPKRIFIEKRTGREIAVGRSADILFFVPTKYWAFIGVGLSILMAVRVIVFPMAHTAATAQVPPTTAPAQSP